MATSYRATVQATVQKQHRCVGCGGLFRYPMKRSATVQGATAPQAEAGARSSLGALLAAGVDPHPCATCGIYQPEMVAKMRGDRVGFVAFLAHVAPGALAALGYYDVIPWHIAAWGAGGAGALALLFHLRAALLKPNGDLEANRRKAEAEIGAGKLKSEQAGGSIDPAARPGASDIEGGRKLLLALFAAAVVALPSAELLRLARGWPLNPDWTPGVIGPGDSARLFFQSISSVAGKWLGEGSARVLPPGAPVSLSVESHREGWSGTIRAKSSEKYSSTTPWARVHFDTADALAGTTLPVHVDLEVTFPAASGSGYSNTTRTLSAESQVRLAPPRAGEVYYRLLLGGLLGGSALLCVLGIALVKRRDALGAPSETALFAKD